MDFTGEAKSSEAATKDNNRSSAKRGFPRKAKCPSCEQEVTFTFVGEQHWPEQVAKAANISKVITLWCCSNCNTTITLDDLAETDEADDKDE